MTNTNNASLSQQDFNNGILNLLEAGFKEGNRSTWTQTQKNGRNAKNRIARKSRRKNRSR